MTQNEITDGNDPRLYERGNRLAHCSDNSGYADVGLSVGLGRGLMLYVGEVAKSGAVGIRIWGLEKGTEIVVGEVQDFDAARDMIDAITFSINNTDE